MKKLTFISALASLSLSLPLSATTVQFGSASAATARQAVLDDGSTLVSNSNNEVLLGWISNTSFTFSSALSVQQNLTNAGFSEFGLAQPGNGASEASTYTLTLSTTGVFPHSQVAGAISDESTPQSGVNASFFDGKQIYIVIVNGTTIAAATQMGIFTSASWTFPVNTGDANTDTSPTFVTNTGTSVSAVGAGQVNSSPNQLELAPAVATPEPSTLVSLIGAGGLLGVLRRRRTA